MATSHVTHFLDMRSSGLSWMYPLTVRRERGTRICFPSFFLCSGYISVSFISLVCLHPSLFFLSISSIYLSFFLLIHSLFRLRQRLRHVQTHWISWSKGVKTIKFSDKPVNILKLSNKPVNIRQDDQSQQSSTARFVCVVDKMLSNPWNKT